MASPPTPTQERIRLTITVTPETHAIFKRFADASGMSIGRAMGEWLQDTGEAAEQMVMLLERARAAPKLVIRELHGMALGLADEAQGVITKMREGTLGEPVPTRSVPPARPAAPPPRPVIRGGKSPSKGHSRGRS